MNRETHRGGFTLVELLVVTVVVVTLMGVVFRLAGAGGENRAKASTIARMQRIENALSGYYAAYGSYPPVPLQGRSRSIYKAVDARGLQESGDGETGSTDLKQGKTMNQILAACRAQPLSVSWPAPAEGDIARMASDLVQGYSDAGVKTYGSFRPLSGVGSLRTDEIDWRGTGANGKGVQLFEFGLLSFLLPRYFFMLEGKMDNFYDNKKNGRAHGQWVANNQLPCRLDTGEPFADWKEVRKIMGEGGGSSSRPMAESWMISNLTSQAVCARWMPNFKGIISTINTPKYNTFFGVNVYDSKHPYFSVQGDLGKPADLEGDDVQAHWLRIGSPGGYSGSASGGGSGYLLLSMTIRDGWGQEFFYYSEPPYQSYRLWSAGPNKVTFPPWYDLDQFSGSDLKQIQKFTEDDIVHLSN